MPQSTAPASQPLWNVQPTSGLQINSVAISADGQRCIAGTSNEFSTGQFAVYCYDASGNQQWSMPVGEAGSTQGVFWVAVSADGKYAAAGGETASSVGFLVAYNAADGTQLLTAPQSARINQVALSSDGATLLAVGGGTVQLYTLGSSGYTLTQQQDFSPSECNSCAISADGSSAVVSTTLWNSVTKTSTGTVVSFDTQGGQLTATGTASFGVGVMRVAMASTGAAWGASLHDGSCVLLAPGSETTPVWQFKPTLDNLSVAYGFDITQTSDGRVVLAVGANLHVTAPPAPAPAPNMGLLYVVEAVTSGSAPAPKLLWSSELQYSANPGVSLDQQAAFVTATDGQPGSETPGHVTESAGNFYLCDAVGGNRLWAFPTDQMNWPMTITPDGSAIFGGSDTGSVYYWGQTPR